MEKVIRKSGRYSLIAMFSLLLVFAASGCINGKLNTKPKSKGSPSLSPSAEASPSASGSSEFGKSGSSQGAAGTVQQGKLPDNFPKDIPLPPGAKIDSSGSISGGSDLTVLFSTDQSVADAIQFYKTQLTQQGWQVNDSFSATASGGLLLAKKNAQALSVAVSSTAGKTDVLLTLAPENAANLPPGGVPQFGND